MKNVCIVGYGAIGPTHAYALKDVENAKLYAVCDTDKKACEKAKNDYAEIVLFDDFDKMLEDKNVDSVHICTPHFLHFQMIEKALKKGKTVICEKPLVMTKEEMDKLLKLENADKVGVVFQNRLTPCIKKAKEIVESDKYGKILAVKGIVTWKRTKEYYSDDWHGKLVTEGGGVLINQTIHTFDFFNYLTGGIAFLKAIKANFMFDIEVEDTFMASLKLKCGADALFFVSNAYGKSTKPEFEIIFENATLNLRNDKLYLNDELIAENSGNYIGKDYWGIGHVRLLKNFYDNNERFSPFDVKSTMDGVFAMYESAKQGGKEIIILGDKYENDIQMVWNR